MTHVVEEQRDEEFVYTVEMRRPFEDECDGGDPNRCWHDGTNKDAIAEFERDLCERLPKWRVRVFARGRYKPSCAELVHRLDMLIAQVKAGRGGDATFRRVLHTVQKLKDFERWGNDERASAEEAIVRAREMLGL